MRFVRTGHHRVGKGNIMCLAVPAKVIQRDGVHAVVESGGVQREGNLTFVPDADVGDYVLIHAGFAIQKWGPEDVKEFNEIIANVNLQDGDST